MGSSCCSVACRDKARIGAIVSAETREKLSRALKGKLAGAKNPRYGKTPAKPIGYGIRGWYKGVYFRSTYEVRLAKALDALDIRWVYESKRFKYINSDGNDRTCLVDFFLPDTDEWLEVKGYVREEHINMIAWLRANNVNIALVTNNVIKQYEARARGDVASWL